LALKDRLLPAPVAAAALLALILAPAALLPRIEVNNAPEAYFPTDAEAVRADNAVREVFPNDQVLVALFAGGRELYETAFLQALQRVVDILARNPDVERTLTVTSVDHIEGTEDGFLVAPLLDPKAAGRSPEKRRARVLGDRFAPGLIVSKDGDLMALVVRPGHLQNSYQRLRLVDAFHAAVAEAGIERHLVAVTGSVPVDVAELRSMIRDTLMFVPATSALGLLLVWWMYRRVLAVVLTLASITAVALSTVGLLIGIGQPYTLTSAMIPPLMAALTTAFVVHLFNALVHVQQRGYRGRERVLEALATIRRPSFYAALTTAAGLASLGVSPIRPVAWFGLVSGAGVMLLYLVVTRLLPPILVRWDHGAWVNPGAGGRLLDNALRTLSSIGIRRARWVLIAAVLGGAAGIPQIWRVQAETDLYEFFAEDHPITQSTHRVEAALSGVTSLQVSLRAPARDSFKAPDRLRVIDAFQAWLDEQPEVDRTLSMVDVIEEMNWAFHAEDPGMRRLPDNPALISQYLFIYDGTDLYDLVNRELDWTLVTMNLNVRGANATSVVMERIRERLRATNLGDMQWEIAGFGRLIADQEDLLITGQVRSLFSALAMIFLFMALQWRSAGAAALCMIPNFSPILLIFIVMGTFGIWLDAATAMVASVAVGIAVDDTIHTYHGYRRRRAAGASPVAALARSYHHAGRAVLLTTAILSAQFLLLGASQFIPTTQFGLLTTVGLVSALLFDLLLLPALIIALAGIGRRRRAPG